MVQHNIFFKKSLRVTLLYVTRIKATRCETLRTVTKDNSKNNHFWHIASMYCWWFMKTIYFDLSQAISHINFWNVLLSRNGSLRKMSPYNFSPTEPISLIVYENNLFWYITNQCSIRNFEICSQKSSPEPNVSSYDFFHFWPHCIHSPWKWSILIYHNPYGIGNFEMSSKMSWRWAGYNIFSLFWPHFIHNAVKLLILMCHTMYFKWNFKMSSQICSIKLNE